MLLLGAVVAAIAFSLVSLAGTVERWRLSRFRVQPSSPATLDRDELIEFVRPYRRSLGVGFALTLTGIAFDLAAPWPLKIMIDNAIGGEPLPGWLEDLDGLSPHQLAFWATATTAGLILFGSILDYLTSYVLGATEVRLAADLRGAIFRQLQFQSLRFHDRNRSGDLVNRLMDDVSMVRDVIVIWLNAIIPDAVLLVGVLILMLTIDVQLTFLALLVVPMLIFYAVKTRPRIKAAARTARTLRGQITNRATDKLRNVRAIQTFSQQEAESRHFNDHLGAMSHADVTSLDVSARYRPVVDISVSLSRAVLTWIGVVKVLSGDLSLGTLLVFLSYLSSLYGPIRNLSRQVSTFAKASASLERLREIFDPAFKVEDNPNGKELPAGPLGIGIIGVEFAYDDDAPVAQHVSFVVRPNETVCIVGSTGAGKSTLLSLLLRLYEPSEGTIVVGGRRLNEIKLSSLRERIALVPQEPWMLDTTIGDNISFGQSGVTPAEVRFAAEQALVNEFADRLPDGYDTLVGEAGVLLSGGQRQRIALARALLRNASILLLDEPTTGLDAKSEEMVLQAIKAAGHDRTVVIVSHRLRVAETADRVIVLEAGKVVEDGTHNELLASGGRYTELWHAQNNQSHTNHPLDLTETPSA